MNFSSVYVHLPFCRRRCSYCPFAISVDSGLSDRYFAALRREIESTVPASDSFDSIYLGGGTPSHSPESEIRSVVEGIAPRGLSGESELTLEANPEDIDESKIESWKTLGITRLSVGVQSLHDDELRPIGRLHGRDLALESLRLATAARFRTNADLIIGLPGQTRESFNESIELVLESGVGHISLYVLDMDEDTPLRRRVERGKTVLPDEDLVTDLYLEAVTRSESFGLDQYEISNFARPDEQSRHNLAYWNRVPYLSVGLGAHSYDGTKRWANVRSIDEYISRIESGASAVDFEEVLSAKELEEEEIFLSLRQKKGIAQERLIELAGEAVQSWLAEGQERRLLEQNDGSVSFTAKGFLFSNELIAELF